MHKKLLINKIVTSILLISVFCLSVPHYSYATTEDDTAAQTAAAAARQNAAQNNTTAPTQTSSVATTRTTSSNTNTIPKAIPVTDAQAEAYDGDTSQSTGNTGSVSDATADALGCSAGALLGNMITSGLKSLITDTVVGELQSQQTVPINTQRDQNTRNIKNAATADADVNAYQQINGIATGSSWNGIAFCIVNGLITYIADSTIAWINSGFQGNPAFIENTGNFMQGLADRQASEFIGALAYNTTGLNVCEPFRVDLAIALSEVYGGQDQAGMNSERISCSMDQIGQSFENFANGGGMGGANIDGYWSNWNQMRQTENNPWGAYMEAGEYLRAQIATKQNTATFELGLNNGYLDFKKCEDPADAKRGNGTSCRTYTPGSLIQSSLEDTLKIPKERLVAADKIDQVITALANALIKKALNTVLEEN